MTEILLYPALVQGSGAPSQLIAGLRYFEKSAQEGSADAVDVVIIGRGGGSIEDLWAFNDEGLARAVAGMSVPVISAVGHETDFTICDFVADTRAPTPSAAAELAVPDAETLRRQILNLDRHFASLLLVSIGQKRARVRELASSRGLSRPSHTVDEKRIELDRMTDRIDGAVYYGMESRKNELCRIAERLQALNPLGVLSRGYCAVSRTDGQICTTASALTPGDRITLRFADGVQRAEILGASEGEESYAQKTRQHRTGAARRHDEIGTDQA